MNIIRKRPVQTLGYDFIPKQFIPKGKNEYYLREQQNPGDQFRALTAAEIRILERNGNTSDDWKKVLVMDAFDPELVRHCKFYGLVRIGKLEPYYHEFNNLRLPVGLYYSTIISSDIGDNPVIDHVNFLSHYIIGKDVMLVNINEMATTDHAKFGNGIIKEGEKESVRIWLELCNENAGRRIMPFDGMLPADAWIGSRFRDDEILLTRLKTFTERKMDNKRGWYGEIGDRTVIKNCKIIKDVKIGTDAYLKGANKLKNLTINSSAEAQSQIGEGCELVNGIIGYGCRVFYGVKAVRFILSSNSQLKYGARLINSYLGDNSTISCCEVLNSLIFPGHEQHHNNSFLCASLVMGQSNIAAGATIGSNHNSRSADGELIAGRGFWPGLCVSLKHNSKFASYTLINKGDFPAELNIPIPFSLVSNDVANDRLLVMPAYWFLYNMYALARNAEKYTSRDKRTDKTQFLEFDFLAPDTINEVFDALGIMKISVANSFRGSSKKHIAEKDLLKSGAELLEKKPGQVDKKEIIAEGFENSKRKTVLAKLPSGYKVFKSLIIYYGVTQLMAFIERERIRSWDALKNLLPRKANRNNWKNMGGQLIPANSLSVLIRDIKSGSIRNWEGVHEFYRTKSNAYPDDKLNHAYASLLEILDIHESGFKRKLFIDLLRQASVTRSWMVSSIKTSRARDHSNPFRQMIYESKKEMDAVLGKLKDNAFILQQEKAGLKFREQVNTLIRRFAKD